MDAKPSGRRGLSTRRSATTPPSRWTASILHTKSMQSELVCFEPACRAHFPITDAIYTCPTCGALLEVEMTGHLPADVKSLWRQRRTCNTPIDQSGVWRYRELLPFGAAEGA